MSDTDRNAADGGEGVLPRALASWPRAYFLVIAVLAADVALLWLLGRLYG